MFHNIQANVDAWRNIGAPDFLITWIIEGIPLNFTKTPPCLQLPNPHLSINHLSMDSEVDSLLKAHAIRKCLPGELPWCVSPIKTVNKKGGTYRLIIDLHVREVNKCTDIPKFSQEGIEFVAQIIQPNDLLLTLDLKSGFHHCKIQPGFQKYLGFKHRSDFYAWQALPFGLQSSPYHFHKLLRPVVQFLRSNGLRLVFYVDDCILLATKSVTTDHKDFLLHTLEDLGLGCVVAVCVKSYQSYYFLWYKQQYMSE